MAEKSAYLSPVLAQYNRDALYRSQEKMAQFYGETPANPADLLFFKESVHALMEQLKGVSWANLGEVGTLLLMNLRRLSEMSQDVSEAQKESFAATRLRHEFGTVDENSPIFELALPVFWELGRNELTSRKIVREAGAETLKVTQEVSRLFSVALIALEKETENQQQELEQWKQTHNKLEKLDNEGHSEIQSGKQDGGARIERRIQKLEEKKASIQQLSNELDRRSGLLGSSGVIFSSYAATEVVMSDIQRKVA